MGARKGLSETLDLDEVYADLLGRAETLRARLAATEDGAKWREYLDTIDLLLQIEDRLARQETNGRAILTTREMADRLGISVKALLRRKKQGRIRPSVAHGKALGWRVEDAMR